MGKFRIAGFWYFMWWLMIFHNYGRLMGMGVGIWVPGLHLYSVNLPNYICRELGCIWHYAKHLGQ